MLEVLHAPRFVELAPAQVYAHLLDEGRYLCSPRTMYRLLAAADEVRERRNQLEVLLLEVIVIADGPARPEVTPEVLHSALDLPLRLRAIGPAEPRLEAPILGERLAGRSPDALPVLATAGGADGPGRSSRGSRVCPPKCSKAASCASRNGASRSSAQAR